MGYIGVFICLGFFFLNRLKDSRIYNPLSIMSLYWSILLLLCSLNLTDSFETSDKAYALIILGVIFFAFGYLASNKYIFKLRSKSENYLYSNKFNNNDFNKSLFFILTVIALTSSIAVFQSVLVYFQSGYGLYDIRYQFISEIYGEGYADVLNVYIVKPVGYIMTVYSVTAIINKQKYAYLQFLIAVLLLTLQIVNTGGRLVMLFLLVSLLFCVFLFREKLHFSFRERTIFFLLITGVVGSLFYVSIVRESNLIENLYDYAVSSITFLSICLKKYDSGKLFAYTYGYFSWYGIFNVPVNVMEFITRLDMSTTVNNLIKFLSSPTMVSDHILYNWFATAFFRFYADLNYWGVIINSFIWGCICRYTYRNWIKVQNFRNLFVYVMVTYGIVVSCMTFVFSDVSMVLSIIYIYILTDEKLNKNRKTCQLTEEREK